MKTILLALACVVASIGCNSSTADCAGDNCICPATESCEHDCTPGAVNCHVQGQANQPVDVQCADNAECHVECSAASSCKVDCGGSTECHVTCPATGCTVTACVGDCAVTCGALGQATKTGTTATCP